MIDIVQNVAIGLLAAGLLFAGRAVRYLTAASNSLRQVAEIQSERISRIER